MNNSPYITGERLQILADISIITDQILEFHVSLKKFPVNMCLFKGGMRDFVITDEERLRPIKDANIIFVYTHLLETFFEKIFRRLERPIVLMSHNSDDRIDNRFLRYLNDGTIIRWFAQNVAIDHEKVTALPLGIANYQWAHGQIHILDQVVRQRKTKNKLIYMNFDMRTNPGERAPVYNLFKDNPLVTVSGGLDYRTYLEELASHVFCISPPGNGLDCHRIWECLYLGVIPIVLDNPNMKYFRDLPILFIEDWQQIDERFLQKKYRYFQDSSFNYRKINMNYWKKHWKKQIQCR